MLITLRNVEKSYPQGVARTYVLRRINLYIKEGEFVSIMGPSGAGKSTLLHIFGMHDATWSGEYSFMGQPIHALGTRERSALQKRHIGFVFQRFFLLPMLTAAENVDLPQSEAGVPKAERRKRSLELLEYVPTVLAGPPGAS